MYMIKLQDKCNTWTFFAGFLQTFFTIAHSLSAHYNLMIAGFTHGAHLSAVLGFLWANLTDYKQYGLTNTRSLPNNATEFVNISYCIRYHEQYCYSLFNSRFMFISACTVHYCLKSVSFFLKEINIYSARIHSVVTKTFYVTKDFYFK